MPDLLNEKRLAAQRALDLVRDGMTLGLGSGSTSAVMVELLSERVRAGLRVRGVPTSESTRALAERLGITLATFAEVGRLDLTIDGADQIDANYHLTKGGGGALLREKITAFASDCFVVIADSSKFADRLGSFLLPVEVFPFGERVVADRLVELGARPRRRLLSDGRPWITDQGNHILDCDFGPIHDPPALAARLEATPGVAAHGLFIDYADVVIVGHGNEATVWTRQGPARRRG